LIVPAAKPRVRQDVASIEMDGETVIYDESNGSIHHLNAAATVVFTLCDGTQSLREMSAEIASAFHVDARQVEAQVRTLVREMRTAGLLGT
jgi:PqqD family protein of HPr-rel-A system